MKLFRAASIVIVSLVLCKSGVAATVIDDTGNWAGQSVGTWGEPPATATVGQTFTVGSDTRLDSFTFYVGHNASFDQLTFAAYVMQWNPASNEAVGPVLYQSGTLNSTDAGNSLLPVTVATGGVELTEGEQYIAFFSTSAVNAGNGIGWIGYAGSAYAGGEFAYSASGTNFSALSSQPWVTNYPDSGGDLAFQMDFNTVPEPSALAVFSVFGIGLLVRRRRAI
jgi:hypothetical protein